MTVKHFMKIQLFMTGKLYDSKLFKKDATLYESITNYGNVTLYESTTIYEKSNCL